MARPKIEFGYLIDDRNDFIIEMYYRGYKQTQIAKIFNIPRNTVSVVIRKHKKDMSLIDGKKRTEYYRKYKDVKYKNNIQFKLSAILRSRINHFISKKTKSNSSIRDLGCTLNQLKTHIESQFKEGMTWDNWGEWHIDHIKPLSLFDLTDQKQFLEACHYTNLQPLWATDNIKKGNKVI